MIIYATRHSPYDEPLDFFSTMEKAEAFCKEKKEYYDTYKGGEFAILGDYYIEEIEVL